MSQKNKDNKNRWRNKTIAFRVSPEEYEQISTLARLSGLSKQDYLINRTLQRDIIVRGSPRTYKMLRDELQEISHKLDAAEDLKENFDETLIIIEQINKTISGFKNN